jgi:hypothetical protein
VNPCMASHLRLHGIEPEISRSGSPELNTKFSGVQAEVEPAVEGGGSEWLV